MQVAVHLMRALLYVGVVIRFRSSRNLSALPRTLCSRLRPQADGRKRTIDPLAPVNHSAVEYDEFGKDFYTEAPAIAAMGDAQVRTPRGRAPLRGTP